jgi:hypothetical protein
MNGGWTNDQTTTFSNVAYTMTNGKYYCVYQYKDNGAAPPIFYGY